MNNLHKSHFMPAGSGLMVKPETHNELKEFQNRVMKLGFKAPEMAVYNTNFDDFDVDLSFGGSEKIQRIETLHKSKKQQAEALTESKSHR